MIRVHLLVKGRIGAGWLELDRIFKLPDGSTLATLFDEAEKTGVALREALDQHPHLRRTMMLNGERRPVDETLDRALDEGDEIYLLSSIAGG